MLEKVIPGNQSGTDQSGWRAAQACGMITGGAMPAGWLTEDGPRPDFSPMYGARELPGGGYAERTRANAKDADGTV